MSTVPGIYKKLHAIMGEANYIQKSGENKFHGYKYASEADIKDKLHGLFVKHGVVFNVSIANQLSVQIHNTSKGAAQYRTTVTLAYRFIDVEDGSTMEGTFEGAGVDGEDKGVYKATTGALKYCLTTTFVIPTGDDPESANGDAPERAKKEKPANRGRESTTVGTPPPKPNGDSEYISEGQRNRLYAIVGKAKWEDAHVKALLSDFGVNSSKLIPKYGEAYDRICKIIENQDYAAYIDAKTNQAVS